MDNQLKSISKVFTQTLLRIPDYQRGYAWGDKQLKDFWSDILQLEDGRNHYVGVLTFEQVPKEDYEAWKNDRWIIDAKCFEPYYVVDGQQRLTTTLILIQSILETLPENGTLNFTTYEEIKKRYIYDLQPESLDNSGSYIFGYHEDNPSYEFLKTKIFGRISGSAYLKEETIYTRNLLDAKNFFLEKLSLLNKTEIESIYKKVTQHFLFNIYSISSEIDVHVAFEGMNNRGKPLSILELLKNRLIYLSTKFDITEFEKVALRRRVNECWRSVYHFLGKNKDNPLEDDRFLFNHYFLFYYQEASEIEDEIKRPLTSRLKRTYKHDYHNFLLDQKFTLKNLQNPNFTQVETTGVEIKKVSEKDVFGYAQSLQQSVESWYYIFNPLEHKDLSDDEKKWLDRINKVGLYDMSTLLLALLIKRSKPNQILGCLKAIERLLFVRSILHSGYYYTFGLEFKDLSYEVLSGKRSFDSASKYIDDECSEIVDNDEFLKNIRNDFKRSGFYNWPGIRYFLYEYEQYLKNKSKTNTEKINWFEFKREVEDFITIEHIYPQTDRRKCWEVFAGFSSSQKKALKNSLGNLLPLSRPKNSSLQDKCFIDKKENSLNTVGYKYGSFCEIQVSSNGEWTASHILDRGLTLLDFMERRWEIDLGDYLDKVRLLGLEFLIPASK